MDVPSTSVCELLDQLINLFCFYNGSVRQAYQVSLSAITLQPFTFQTLTPQTCFLSICRLVSAELQPAGAGSALGSVPGSPSVGLLRAPSHLHLLEDHRRHQRASPSLSAVCFDCVSTSCAVYANKKEEGPFCPAGRLAPPAQSRAHSPGLPALPPSVGWLHPLQRAVS